MESKTTHADSVQILIVEDSATQAARLKYFLEQRGYRVAAAQNGQEALTAVRASPPDLVISDIVMPEMDGFQLCHHIKQDEQFKNLPVILLTSLSDPVDVVRGLECGADNLVFKPYEEEYLLARITFLLATRHVRETESTKMGVEIRFSGHKLFIGSERLQILNLLLSTYEAAAQKNRELTEAKDELKELNKTLEAKVKERTAALETEILEHKQAEERIREQAALLDKARDAIMVCDPNDRLVYWNKSAERVYGWTAAEALGKNADELLTNQESPQILQAKRQVLERGEWMGEQSQVTKDGKSIIVESRWTLVRESAGQPKSKLVINTDITERKNMEARFLRNQRMENIGTLAGGIAHDLNNALAPILMSVQLLRMRFDDPTINQTLDVLETSAQRGADMVKQVLTFARGIEGRHGTVQLKHLVCDLVTMAKQTFPKSIQLKEQVSRNIWPISGDATHLHQVLLNLAVNARDAMPEGGVLTFAAANAQLDASSTGIHPDAKAGPYIVLTVIDTGIGMPPHIQERIFEPFFTTKEPGKGTGLGLSTVMNIVKNHDGFLILETAEKKGTQFKIYFPAIVTGAASNELTERIVLPGGNGEWILVVDDEALIRDMARQMLQAFGYQILVASNGAEAVATCAKHIGQIQVMVVDLNMPVMDGAATIEAVRALDPTIKVIIASGSSLEGTANQPEKPTVRAVLGKPYSAEKLLATLQGVLSDQSLQAVGETQASSQPVVEN